jgi:hypothetical protein
MKNKDFVMRNIEDIGLQMRNFLNTAQPIRAKLGITEAEMDQLKVFCDNIDTANLKCTLADKTKEDWHAYRQILVNGPLGTITYPVTTGLDQTQAYEKPTGAVKFFRKLAARVKLAAIYDCNLGQQLGIIGPEDGLPDLNTVRPVLTAFPRFDYVVLRYLCGRFDGVEIHVDRADGKGFGYFGFFNRANPEDHHAFPVEAKEWRYYAVYHYKGKVVGQASEHAKVLVRREEEEGQGD